MDFDDFLSIAFGIFAGAIIADLILTYKHKEESEEEYIVTSRGRKLFVSEVTKKKIEAVSKA